MSSLRLTNRHNWFTLFQLSLKKKSCDWSTTLFSRYQVGNNFDEQVFGLPKDWWRQLACRGHISHSWNAPTLVADLILGASKDNNLHVADVWSTCSQVWNSKQEIESTVNRVNVDRLLYWRPQSNQNIFDQPGFINIKCQLVMSLYWLHSAYQL